MSSRPVSKTSGFSLAEMLLVTALTAIVLGTVVSLYSFTMTRAARSVSKFTVADQANRAADVMADTVRNAVSCSLVASGNTGLRCLMPEVGTDTTGDGYLDQFRPKGVSRRGIEKYGAGKRVWFYRSSTGAYASTGTILRRAERSDDALPVGGDVDPLFTFYQNTQQNYPLVTNVQWSVDAAKHEVTITVTASSVFYKEAATPGGTPSSDTETFVAKRTVKWRNWRR
jgi:type II secretory pathway pseudopilin PulG